MFEPYKQQSTNLLYNLLFCDDIELFRPQFQVESTDVWKELLSQTPNRSNLSAIAADELIESRTRLLAFNALRNLSKPIIPIQVLGVVVELWLPQGMDTIAAYKDYRARYINYSEKVIMWEAPSTTLNDRIRRLFDAAQNIVNKIGPWDKRRLAPPGKGIARATFLTTNGLYFGQGPQNVLETDTFSNPLMKQAEALIVDLIHETRTSKKS